jgi:type I restriction enzyme S subunit
MSNVIPLKNVAKFVEDKISSSALNIESYITTDNLLPNKAGVKVATNLPPSSSNSPAYKCDDILISNIRPYLKKIWFSNKDGGCSADVLVLRANREINPKFLYYALFRDDFFAHAMRGAKGTKMPRGDKTQILEFSIPKFSPQNQVEIARFLTVIDSKIDCNNRINKELESLAKLLYDYWFVQFDFPDSNGKPYKSNGGKMSFNATLKREIPEGWNNGPIGNLISLEYGKGLKAEARTGSGFPVLGSSGIVGFHSEFLVSGPGIVVGRKGTVGAITYVHDNFFPIDTTYYVRPKLNIKFYYLKQLLSSIGLEKMNSDSAVPGLNREAALRTNIALPPEPLIQEFEVKTESFINKMRIHEQETSQLVTLRDWLLPMLMNGQVAIS